MTVKLTFIKREGSKDLIFLIEGGKYSGKHINLFAGTAIQSSLAGFFWKNQGDSTIMTTDANLEAFANFIR